MRVVVIFENGGSMLTLSNSIVAGNASTNEPGDDCDNCGAQSSYNLINTTSNSPPINPLLAILGAYGGSTQTMIPLPGECGQMRRLAVAFSGPYRRARLCAPQYFICRLW